MGYDYWIVSAPGDPSLEAIWRITSEALKKFHDCSIYKIQIPNLKVGMPEEFYEVSNELSRIEMNIENLLAKLADELEVLLDRKEAVERSVQVENETLHNYLTTFKWNMDLFPTRHSLKTMIYMVEEQISNFDSNLTAKVSHYNRLVSTLAEYERKRYGNLMTRFIGDVVSKDDFVLGSEFLTTLVVVVPATAKDVWLNKYERLSSKVVPKSSKLILEDAEHALFTVTIFKTAQKHFIKVAKDSGFVVRNFKYDEKEALNFKKETLNLHQEKQKLFQPILKFCETTFSDCYVTLAHIKASKLYVDSLLRYGESVPFLPLLLVTNTKMTGKVRNWLDGMYCHFDPLKKKGSTQRIQSTSDLTESDKHPYVFNYVRVGLTEILAR